MFKLNVESPINSANRVIHKVRSYCRCSGQFPPVTALNLYNSLVAPILAYGCEVWFSLLNQNLKESIDKLKLKFLKSILKVRQQTSTIGVLGELATCTQPQHQCIQKQ